MPEPQADPQFSQVLSVGRRVLWAGLAITALKFTVFGLTQSVAVLSDALESIINVAAAAVMLYSIHVSNRPADPSHPYGHGKAESLAVGFEGGLVLLAALVIAYEAIKRFFNLEPLPRLDLGLTMLGGVTLLTLGLALYAMWMGRRYANEPLRADGKHLLTDFASTAGVLCGLGAVRLTGWQWLDPVVALAMAAVILWTGGRLLAQAIDGLMDRVDPRDDQMIRDILDKEIASTSIQGYHKLRHRHSGAFHWVDVHLQVRGDMTVRDGHALASRIEHAIELALEKANVTAHIEPEEAAGGGRE
ncbi:MAG: cation transporter [Phycisphaeraceae bacterium]|nr:cation transporter [Phycisphaeraceae bacterium]